MARVIVIGGGAAGMMAAYGAGLSGHEVLLLEKNEKLGKKIYITGKGRCNFTNACDVEDFLKNVVTNPKFLYSALYTLDSFSMIDFIENNGTKTKVERGNRAFPESDHASDITHALSNAMRSVGVKVFLNTKVSDLVKQNNTISGVLIENGFPSELKNYVNGKIIECDNVIIATGGISYKSTGSDGDGHRISKKLSHSITELRPALVPFNVSEEYIKELQGLTLKNVNLRIINNEKQIFSEFGDLLFTHFGVSGPIVLSASSIIGKQLYGVNKVNKLKAYIDLKPALELQQIEDRIIREIEENPNKKFINIIKGFLPSSMVEIFVQKLELDDDLVNNSVTKELRIRFANLLKNFDFTIVSLRDFNEAIVTSGGVSVKEIDPSTMKSKLVDGLSFAGEIIDVDAFTGGFNLQIAFSTGYLAGLSI